MQAMKLNHKVNLK